MQNDDKHSSRAWMWACIVLVNILIFVLYELVGVCATAYFKLDMKKNAPIEIEEGQIGGKVPYELVDNKEGPLITTYEQMLEQKDKFYCDYNLLKTCVAFSDTLVWDVIEFEEGIVVPVLCNTSSLQRSKYSGHSYTPYGTVVEEPCEIVDEIKEEYPDKQVISELYIDMDGGSRNSLRKNINPESKMKEYVEEAKDFTLGILALLEIPLILLTHWILFILGIAPGLFYEPYIYKKIHKEEEKY